MGFRAWRIFEGDNGVAPRLVEMDTDQLSAGDVVVRVQWSGINYKDALALTGRGKILRRFPLNAGIDASGIVESSSDPRFRPGDPVLVNGMGLGETQDGGLAGRLRVPGDWIVPLPPGLSPREAMALGTAGFTAALAIQRMEQNGQRPEQGPVVVTGATGGVGSVAISILSGRGYSVTAVSGRPQHREYLLRLGASEVVTPEELRLGSRPLEAARFGGAIDNVGGELLAGLTRHVGLWGQIACVGMAASGELVTTVFPLILRGVSLLGVSSANCPMELRKEVWNRLGADLAPRALGSIVSEVVPLESVLERATRLIERRSVGRTLVDCSGEGDAPR
jgi:acrylyl-CoA reductase (NADPH)